MARMARVYKILMPVVSLNLQHCRKFYAAVSCYSNNKICTLVKEATLYIHWPFCKHLCPYCNFNKYVRENVDHERMKLCLVSELKTLLSHSEVKRINSIYFGGGTPSLCKPSTIGEVIENVANLCELPSDTEISLEVNPSSAETSKLRKFKSAGVNRVSVGIQALNDTDLVKVGRDHNVEDAVRTVEEAADIFDGKYSIDLLFGRPGQSIGEWIKELKWAIELSGNHISLYQLTMERSTPMEKMHRKGELTLPPMEEVAEMYESAVQVLESEGLHRYEVANFSKPNHESKHNTSYWKGYQYIGIGPGAHGRYHYLRNGKIDREARAQTPNPDYWMNEVEKNGHATRKASRLSTLETLEELIIQGMRSSYGVENETFRCFSDGISLETLIECDSMMELKEDGLIEIDKRGIRATHRGLSVVDSLVPEICLCIERIQKGKQLLDQT